MRRTAVPSAGPQKVRCGPAAKPLPRRLHTAFIAIAVPFLSDVAWTHPSPCAAPSPPGIGPKAAMSMHGGGGGWHVAMVGCSHLQLAAPICRLPFAALPFGGGGVGKKSWCQRTAFFPGGTPEEGGRGSFKPTSVRGVCSTGRVESSIVNCRTYSPEEGGGYEKKFA